MARELAAGVAIALIIILAVANERRLGANWGQAAGALVSAALMIISLVLAGAALMVALGVFSWAAKFLMAAWF
jgi:hypothetical protein